MLVKHGIAQIMLHLAYCQAHSLTSLVPVGLKPPKGHNHTKTLASLPKVWSTAELPTHIWNYCLQCEMPNLVPV